MTTPTARPPATRCLLVDDDPAIRHLVVDYLRTFGMAVESVGSGVELRRRLPHGEVDVVLLDLMLPGEGGLSLCPWIKATAPGLPVIMLTAQGDTHSRVVGLELGADDYLSKPFEPRELVARIKAVRRRAGAWAETPRATSNPGEVLFEGWVFQREWRQLRRAGRAAHRHPVPGQRCEPMRSARGIGGLPMALHARWQLFALLRRSKPGKLPARGASQ